MAKGNTKISYDKEEDILNLSKGIPSQSSLEIGDFILDIDGRGFISSIEILNASEALNINGETLEKIDGVSMNIVYNYNYISISIEFKFQNREKEIVIPLTLNLGHKQTQRERIIFVK